jgi:hypothetical protein
MSSFLDNLFTSGTASALATPTGSIDVSSTMPVLDYVLKVINTSPLQAGWMPESGGGGGAGAPVWTTNVVLTGTLAPEIDNQYLVLSPCVITLPDASQDGMNGHSINLMMFSGPNTVKNPSLESPNILIEYNQALIELDGIAGGVLLTAVYQPEVYPYAFWIVQRYALPSFSPVPSVRNSEIWSVYPTAELPTPYDSVTVDGVTTISSNESTVGNIARDFEGEYPVDSLVLMMFLTDVPGLYRTVRDNGGTDWAFEFVEGPGGSNDPSGDPSYYVKIGETWGGRVVQIHQDDDPYYTFRPSALGLYPANGDVLGTGSNSGNAHSNTNQVLPGRINILKPSGPFHTYTLAAPDANQERIFGERFAVKSVQFAGAVTLNINVAPAEIEGPDGLIGDSVDLTYQLGTYAEWQLFTDNVWHLVGWLEGNTGG